MDKIIKAIAIIIVLVMILSGYLDAANITNFSHITTNRTSFTNSSGLGGIVALTFNYLLGAYLIVFMIFGISYYASNKHVLTAFFMGEIATLSLLGIGLLLGVSLISPIFAGIYTAVTIFWFGVEYWNANHPRG